MGTIGDVGLIVGVLGGVGAVATTASGRAERIGRWCAYAATAAMAVALVALAVAFVRSDFTMSYVVDHSRRGVSAPYRLAGLWGGLEGSLVLWTALLGVAGMLGTRGGDRVDAVARTVVAAAVGALAAISAFIANPFDTLQIPAIAGGGLTPILEHPAMVYHPPLLYLGLVTTVVPFAYAVAGGSARRVRIRTATLVALGLLTAGLATGGNWAYVELGWGGYWAWDPVENSALVPWLVLVAGLHWSMSMPPGITGSGGRISVWAWSAPYVLAMFGTLLTRSGATDSVHAFGEQRAVGAGLAVVTAITVLAAVAAVVRADPVPAIGRRAMLGAVVLGILAATIVFVGSTYPVVAGWLGGDDRIVDGSFFARLTYPLAVVALVLAGWVPTRSNRPIVPGAAAALAVILALVVGWDRPAVIGLLAAAAWCAAAMVQATAARTSRWSTRVAHFGFAVVLFGVAGTVTAETISVTLAPGEEVDVGGYTFTHGDVVADARDDLLGGSVAAELAIADGSRSVGVLRPEIVAYPDAGVLLAETGLHSRPLRDIQVVLRDADDDGRAQYDIAVRPLAMFVWWGSALIVAGFGIGGFARGAERRSGRAVVA